MTGIYQATPDHVLAVAEILKRRAVRDLQLDLF
jgi:hypothetical protein